MGFLDTPVILPVQSWKQSSDGVDSLAQFDFIGQNYRIKGKDRRSFLDCFSVSDSYFSRPSKLWRFDNITNKLTNYATDTPHIAWSTVKNKYFGLKVERVTQNYFTNSTATNIFGSTTAATFAASPLTVFGPDGTNSMVRYTSTSNGGYGQSSNFSITASTTNYYTFSVIVPKSIASQTVRIVTTSSGGTGGTNSTDFDTLTGVISSTTLNLKFTGVEDLGSFWRPYIISRPQNDTVVQCRFYPAGSAATGSMDVGWPQFEPGYYPTSLIQTSGGVLRRERDFAVIPFIASGLTQNASTLTVSTKLKTADIERVILQIDDGTEANSIRVRKSTTDVIEVLWTSNSSVVSTMNLGTLISDVSTVISIGWGNGVLKAIRDGVNFNTVSFSPPPGLTYLRLGSNVTTSSLDGFIESLATWNTLRTESFYTAPTSSFVALGDSMAAGSGVSTTPEQWRSLLSVTLTRTSVPLGYPGQSSEYVLQQWQAVPQYWGYTAIIFVGHNFIATTNAPADIASMISLITNEPRLKRFLVVSPLQSTANGVGTAGYNAIVAMRATLKNTYPNNYVDLYGTFAASGDNSSPDNTNIANGYTPASLLADAIHINATGQIIEANLYAQELTKRGW